MNGMQALDRLDFLNECHVMGGERNNADDERERRDLMALFTSVGGRDAMEGIKSLDMCPVCGQTTARAILQTNRPRTCADCWAKDDRLQEFWADGGIARVRV